MDGNNCRLFGHYLPFFGWAKSAAPVPGSPESFYTALLRDHLHYKPEIIDVAAGIVAGLGGTGSYFALHIRRNEFQYQETRQPARAILQNVKALLEQFFAARPKAGKRVVYIASDETSEDFFKPFAEAGYEVRLLRHELEDKGSGSSGQALSLRGGTGVGSSSEDQEDDEESGWARVPVPQEWFGMVEQLVCAQAGVFVGTRLSTFTAFIQRMRGHMQRSSDSSTTPIINTGIY